MEESFSLEFLLEVSESAFHVLLSTFERILQFWDIVIVALSLTSKRVREGKQRYET